MSINLTMTFTKNATSVTLPAPVPGYEPEHHIAQALGQTAAGTWYVYDKNVTTRATKITLELTATQKTNLLTFVDSTLDGAVNTFTWTDHKGTAHSNCRLRNVELQFTKTQGGLFRVDLEILTGTDDLA